jgi:hypothetical protein
MIDKIRERLQKQLELVKGERELLIKAIRDGRREVLETVIHPKIAEMNLPENIGKLEKAWRSLHGRKVKLKVVAHSEEYYGGEEFNLYITEDTEDGSDIWIDTEIKLDVAHLAATEKFVFGKDRKLFEVEQQLSSALKPGVIEQVMETARVLQQ